MREAYHVLERSAENEGKAQEEGAQRDEVSGVATKQCLAKTSIGATHERRRGRGGGRHVLCDAQLEDQHDHEDHEDGKEDGDDVGQHFARVLAIEQCLVQRFPGVHEGVEQQASKKQAERKAHEAREQDATAVPVLVYSMHGFGDQRQIDCLTLWPKKGTTRTSVS